MSYRPDWWDSIAQGRSIPQMALDVMSCKRGSFERSLEDQAKDIHALDYIAKNWKSTSVMSQYADHSFDAGIFNMVLNALMRKDWRDKDGLVEENNKEQSVANRPKFLSLDEVIEKLTALREQSPLGGNTAVVLCEEDREYEGFQDIGLDVDPDGAVVIMSLHSLNEE